MSLQADIITALSGVAGDRIYPQAAPQDTTWPFVVYRVLSKSPENNFCGYSGQTAFIVAFDCWADTYAQALTLAGQVVTAIEASDLVSYRESSPGEEFEMTNETFVEPVYFGFWYAAA